MTTMPTAAPGAGAIAAAPDAARKVGLWVFMGVVSALFLLFGAAYVMRMAVADWRPLTQVPWQLWFSTALLAAASVAWESARTAATRQRAGSARRASLVACAASLAFLAVQLWAWQAMVAMNFKVDGNPANSFFYLLTGLHGVHVVGGLVAAAIAAVRRAPGIVVLCARYWHFLLALWLVVFGLLFQVTPEFVQIVCNSVGIDVTMPQAR